MNLDKFSKYLRKKSIPRLLHRARRDSLDRLVATEPARRVSHNRPLPKRVGTR